MPPRSTGPSFTARHNRLKNITPTRNVTTSNR